MAASNSLVLIGPMGAGKSSVGRRVAKALSLPFFDTDREVVRDHGPIPSIFASHGEAQFRQWERDAVRDALSGNGVVALGGGAVMDAATQSDLDAHRVVLLTVSPEIVRSRLHHQDRPLLRGEDPMQRWTAILRERQALYDQLADLTVDTSTGPLQHAVDTITTWVLSDDAEVSR